MHFISKYVLLLRGLKLQILKGKVANFHSEPQSERRVQMHVAFRRRNGFVRLSSKVSSTEAKAENFFITFNDMHVLVVKSVLICTTYHVMKQS